MNHASPQVLLVDDDKKTLDLMHAALSRSGLEITPALTPREAIELLETRRFNAVVTDVIFDGFSEGAAVLKAARAKQPDAIVILMTGHPLIEGAVSAIKLGAMDYLQKPVDPRTLAAFLHRALKEREIESSSLEFGDLVEILSSMVAHTIERVDPYTAGHGARTRKYCRFLSEELGLDTARRERLELAAIAHDYGKIYLDDLGFLTKNGPLTDAEYKEVQKHPVLGARKLGHHEHLREVRDVVAEHHEKWDGTGYPYKKKGTDISLSGRILGVVEVFDSLSTKRSYKDVWPLDKVLEFFAEQRGRAFDPDVLDRFLVLLERHGDRWMKDPAADREKAEHERMSASSGLSPN
ncbi:MAG: HD domain-containing phosphohydrolase [Planctomycetota bacterium]|nr:HD domain-containing phosphohydrolase [Planctomycetota bacterium]